MSSVDKIRYRSSPENVRQFLLFLCVGIASYFVYMGTLYITNDLLVFPRTLCVTLGYITTVSFHFFTNRYLTFSAHRQPLLPQLLRQMWFIVGSYFLTLVLVYLFVDKLKWSLYTATTITVIISSVVNYLLLKYWIFAKPAAQ